MAPPASKRRKLEHSSDDDDADDNGASSFASLDALEDGDNEAASHGASSEEDEDIDDVEDMDVDESQNIEEEEEDDSARGVELSQHPGSKAKPNAKPNATPRESSISGRRLGDELAFTNGTVQENLFKLQLDELLDQIRPRHGKRETAAEEALHKLKSTIDQIPAISPLPIEDAVKRLKEQSQVSVPFPNPRPPKDAKYKLEYRKPANINVAGSHALKTRSRANEVLEIDMVLTMPSTILEKKDFLNYRFIYKRAYYIACVAAALKKANTGQHELRFVNFRSNPLQPSITIEPRDAEAKTKWRIHILACIAPDVLSSEKLLPKNNCVRSSQTSTAKHEEEQKPPPTPFYNSTIRSDMLVTSYLKILHSASKTSEAYRDACLLGSTWLRQRGIGSNMHSGGFGNFEWSIFIALQMLDGGPKGMAAPSRGYSSYQLFKATVNFLAITDFSKQPLKIGTSDYSPRPLPDGAPVVWDAERSHNVLYKMSSWSYQHLRQEARTTVNMLRDQQYDGFDAAFILRSDGMLYKYDCIAEVPRIEDAGTTPDHVPYANEQRLFALLQRALGDRVSQINLLPSEPASWAIDNERRAQDSDVRLRVGFVVNPETVGRTVDHGPSAEQKTEASSFRGFWGEKAELRRFKDGSIHESLVWSAKEGDPPVLEQIVRFVVQKHFGGSIGSGMRFVGEDVKRLVPHGVATAQFQALNEAYKQMETDVRGLDGMPLSVRQVMPADAQLRSASLNAPLSGRRAMPADVIVQFEGSGRWPDDLVAIQRTKIAFLLKLSELLQDSTSNVTARIGLENEVHDALNQGYLELIYDSGAAFRLRIYHDREQTLLERQLKDKTLDPRSKETAAVGLAKHKRDYVKAPAHTQAIARLCSRYPALSGTIRLMKKWVAFHLLANHFADEVIELLAAKTFVQPWPWQTPSSVQTGFLRTLFFLSRWDWRAEPLIVDLSGSGDRQSKDRSVSTTNFEAWRKLDPALNRVVVFAASNVDAEGTTWTDGRPAKVVAGRMTALAKAACAEISEKQLDLASASLFASPLTDFDFVLHLDPELVGKKKRRKSKSAEFKNLELELTDDTALAGYDPVTDFLQELETLFGAAVLLFSGGHERAVIAGLWNPQTAGRAWKLNLAYSTVPQAVSGSEEVKAEVNKEGILAEMARLGGDMVVKLEGGAR